MFLAWIHVVRIGSDVPLEIVAPLGCGIQTGAGAVLNELKPSLNSTLVVIGTGAVGSGPRHPAQVQQKSVVLPESVASLARHPNRSGAAISASQRSAL